MGAQHTPAGEHSGRLARRPWITPIPMTGLGTRAQRIYLLYSIACQPNPDQERAARLLAKVSALSDEGIAAIAEDRADWLLDAIATATQNRMFLRGDSQCDEDLCDVILANSEKAIRSAIAKARGEAA